MSLSRGRRSELSPSSLPTPLLYHGLMTKDVEAFSKMRKGQVKSLAGGDTPAQSNNVIGRPSDWPAEVSGNAGA